MYNPKTRLQQTTPIRKIKNLVGIKEFEIFNDIFLTQ